MYVSEFVHIIELYLRIMLEYFHVYVYDCIGVSELIT